MYRRTCVISTILSICAIMTACGGGNASGGSSQPLTPRPPAAQVPRSGINHLIVVIMQNNSFDHLFGTYPSANGLDPGAASYNQVDQAGNTVHPVLLTDLNPPELNHTRNSYLIAYDSGKMDKYAWENGDASMDYYDSTTLGTAADGQKFGISTIWGYAQQFALADNFYASAMASEPSNMLYMISADVGTGSDPYGYPQLDACTAGLFQQNQGAGANITPPLTFPNVGDQLSAAKISWTWYHEFYSNEQNGTCTGYVPQENAFQYFQSTANTPNVQDFTSADFQNVLASGSLPSVTWVTPSPAHSMRPGHGDIANGIEWLDSFVQGVKNSPQWADTAVIVFWDESGGWYDHVPPPQLNSTIGLGARVPVLVISPFAKTSYISHRQMDFVSILRFIQWNWALGAFSGPTQAAREQQSGDICDLLTSACGAP
jgi:phospholipase C